MTIYHYDKALNAHHHAGRRSAGEIIAHSESQSFDVSIQVSPQWRTLYDKRYNASLISKDGRPILVVEDSLGQGSIRELIPEATSTRKIHEKAGEIANRLYDKFLLKILLENGFTEND